MRRYASAALFAMVLTTASCESDIIGGLDGEPDVTSMRLSLGTQSLTINASGQVTGGPIMLGAGSSVTVTASFFTSEGEPDPNVTPAQFQLNVTSTGSVTFQRSNVNPFSGTLTAGSAGTSQLLFSLYDLEGQEHKFGPWTVTTVVN